MLDKVKNLVPRRKLEKQQIVSFVLGRGEHLWIQENNCLLAHISDFLERLPRDVLNETFVMKDTIFARSNGKYACSVSTMEQNLIIIFPEIYNLLTKYNDGWAKAVLAHELGHIHLGHSKNMDDPMEAQVDADKFACDMGYLDNLEAFLHDQVESVEKRVRLTFLTNYYFSNS